MREFVESAIAVRPGLVRVREICLPAEPTTGNSTDGMGTMVAALPAFEARLPRVFAGRMT